MKKSIVWIAILALALILFGCSGEKKAEKELSQDTSAEKNLPVLGDNVKFDPNILINDGQPIEVEFWIWDAEEIFASIVEGFEAMYPNVSIRIVKQPWQDYWTKLPLALQNGTGPALFCIHNSQHENLINYLEPYDIDLADLEADFTGVGGHVIDGNVYYVDYGMMTGSIFYNKTMWAEAGLTESDIPETWEQFTDVAGKLTKKDGKGYITQAGFNYNGDVKSMIMGLNYQKGQLMFKEDLSTIDMDNPVTVENMEFLIDLYEKEGVGSKDFGVVDSESFGQGRSAMVYKWGWFYDTMLNDYPDIDFGVFAVPAPSGEVPFAYDRYNGESTVGISATNGEADKSVAQAFIRYFMSNDDAMKELCLRYSIFPAKKAIVADPEVKNHPVMQALAPIVDRLIWPGPFPGIIETQMQQTFEDIIYNGVSAAEAVEAGNEAIREDMAGSDFVTTERQYKYYND